MLVLSTVKESVQEARQDVMVFTGATNGMYAVKRAYMHLRRSTQVNTIVQQEVWSAVWYQGSVLPRMRIFLWKLLHKALPLGRILHSRIGKGDPNCATYGESEEDVAHLIFTCPFSRTCWFAGPLSICSDRLCSNFQEALMTILPEVTSEQWDIVINSFWAIWRCRNENAYAGSTPTFQKFCSFLSKISTETMVASTMRQVMVAHSNSTSQQDTHMQAKEFTCFVDGSWIEQWKGGMGFVLYKENQLLAYRSAGLPACCPFQAEAHALRAAIRHVLREGINNCTFYTDSKVLADLVTKLQPPTEADWRAYTECYEVWKLVIILVLNVHMFQEAKMIWLII